MVTELSNKLYNKLRIIPIFIIIISVLIIGVNFVRQYETEYENYADKPKEYLDIANNSLDADCIIDINSAEFETLQELPGVDYETAKNILEFRIDTGGFKSVQELLLIDGITEEKYKKLLPFVTANIN